MKTIFISQPMKDRTQAAIMEERSKIIELARTQYGDDIKVMDTYFNDDDVPKRKNMGLSYLAKSIDCLADADVAIFAPGWQDYRGCLIENACAYRYGIETVYM